jgi:hypothetical protein
LWTSYVAGLSTNTEYVVVYLLDAGVCNRPDILQIAVDLVKVSGPLQDVIKKPSQSLLANLWYGR